MEEKQAWRAPFILAAMGIAGTLLGAALPHFLALERERTAASRSQKTEAYVGFLTALAKGRVAEPSSQPAGQDGEIANQLKRQYDIEGLAALHRIAIYGDQRVVTTIAAFMRETEALPACGPKWKADFAMWQAMREAAAGRGADVRVDSTDLGVLMLRCKPEAEK